MAKSKNLDKELEKKAGYETVDLSTIPEPPESDLPPEGWPPLIAVDGNTWTEKAKAYEEMAGRRVLPNEYVWDENGNVAKRDDVPGVDSLKKIEKANAKIYERGKKGDE